MSMSLTVHSKNAVEFSVRGYADSSNYYGVYPVIQMDFRDKETAPSNSVTLFPNVEQLYELRKQITKAIRDAHKLKAQQETIKL